MSVPNDLPIIQAVFDPKKHDPTTKMGCGLTIEDFAWALHAHNKNYGLLKKPNSLGGANHWNHHGVDVVCWKSGGRATAIDVFKSGESSDWALGWNPDQEGRYVEADWYAPTGPAAFVLPPHQCKLGASLFFYMGAFRKFMHGEAGWQEKIDRNADYLTTQMHCDYVRDYATVGGHIDSGTGKDPWGIIGSFYRWNDWEDVIRRGIDYLTDKFGLLHAITLVGEGAQFANDDEILQMVGRMARICSDVRPKIFFAEMWNEYPVTQGNPSIVRAMGERFFAGCQTVPFALDTPPMAMGGLHEGELQPLWDEVTMLYGGSHATVITPQWNRSEPNPLDLGPTAKYLLHVSHEPRGPGASAGGDVHNPLPLMHDFVQSTIAAQVYMAGVVNYTGYTAHSMPGVWGGFCDPAFPRENEFTDWYSLPTAAELAHALSSIRAGHMPTGDVPPDKGPPPRPDQLLSGKALNVGGALTSNGFRCQWQGDANLVTYDPAGKAIWASKTAHASPGQVNMQTNGNLVAHTTDGTPLWASGTDGNPGAMCQLNPDGVLTVYCDPAGDRAGEALWSSVTASTAGE